MSQCIRSHPSIMRLKTSIAVAIQWTSTCSAEHKSIDRQPALRPSVFFGKTILIYPKKSCHTTTIKRENSI